MGLINEASLQRVGEMENANRLELGELLSYAECPVPLPETDDLELLRNQTLSKHWRRESLSYYPSSQRLLGTSELARGQHQQLKEILHSHSQRALNWLATEIPQYSEGITVHQVGFHPYEEATRQRPSDQRKDLLGIEQPPSGSMQSWRWLRILVNLDRERECAWMTSDTFATLLSKHGDKVGFPNAEGRWNHSIRRAIPRWFSKGTLEEEGERFLRRFRQLLQRDDEVQEKSPRRICRFPSGAAWMLMTDGLSHGVLRGQQVLDVGVLVSPDVLQLPHKAPGALLRARLDSNSDARRAA